MYKKEEEILGILSTIAGCDIENNFGEPFLSAFRKVFGHDGLEITIAAYNCSLFLSSILEGFPTEKLHTFVRHTRENFHTLVFNCKMYGNIFGHMDENALNNVVLIDRNGNSKERHCCKNDIYEAFDFHTNQ